MAPRKRTAHQQLDELRQRVAGEGVKLRELEGQRALAEAELERVGDAIASAYATEDEGEIAEARKAKEEATARVEELEHRTAGASLRAEEARSALATFTAENARALIEERGETANEVAATLTRAVAEVVRARRAYVAERQYLDQLVSQAPDATTRYDGVSTGYPWEAELKALERAYREHPEAEPPRPRWAGVAQRRNLDAVHRRLRDERGKPVEVA